MARTVIAYYTFRGSIVTLCAFDLSTAFDCVDHYCIFGQLVNKSIPNCFIALLLSWYAKCSASDPWGDLLCIPFPVPSGVR